MRFSITIILAATAATAVAKPLFQHTTYSLQARNGTNTTKPLVTSEALIAEIETAALFAKAEELEAIAYATPKRNRAIGTLGHNNTVAWIVEHLSKLTDYYTFTTQGFPQDKSTKSELLLNDVPLEAFAMVDAPGGSVTAPLYNVPELACNVSDFADFPAGAIAVVFRGTCDRGNKVVLAGNAGAVGVVYRNNAAGANLEDTSLPHDSLPGDLIPTVLISLEDGEALVARLAAGEEITAHLETAYSTYLTYNVVAETIDGDHDNVLHVCSHSDSVPAGPGINDNGSGSISILEVATQLTKFSIKNAVRFSWWSAEEVGLVGAAYYVSQLTQAEKDKQRLVLDYDMMASPNFAYQIYDGDGSAFNASGPAGSAEAEHEFAAFFDSQGLGHTEIEFDGRSDYGPFLEAGIAAGGIACGAEMLKTEEEVVLFGGEAGVAYDINYHSAGDDVANLNGTAWKVMSSAIAHMTAVYAVSWDTIPPRTKRSLPITLKGREDAKMMERAEKAEAEKRALDWVTGPDVRRWTKVNRRA